MKYLKKGYHIILFLNDKDKKRIKIERSREEAG